MSKRALTNCLGIAVLVVFAVVTLQHLHEIKAKKEDDLKAAYTKLNYFSTAFNDSDLSRMSEFVVGQVLDPWGNPIEVRDPDSKEWHFWSAGPDGEWDTKDDIRSRPVTNPAFNGHIRSTWQQKLEAIKDKANKVKDVAEKVKSTKDAVKDAADKVKSIVK